MRPATRSHEKRELDEVWAGVERLPVVERLAGHWVVRNRADVLAPLSERGAGPQLWAGEPPRRRHRALTDTSRNETVEDLVDGAPLRRAHPQADRPHDLPRARLSRRSPIRLLRLWREHEDEQDRAHACDTDRPPDEATTEPRRRHPHAWTHTHQRV